MASNLLSYIGWTFLPNTVYYGIVIRAGDPKPAVGSARYVRDRRRIHMGVISAYLLYTIYEADHEIRRAGDFYQALGVSPDADEREIKSRFRRLAAQLHPDKMTAAAAGGGGARAAAEAYFVQLRLAQDTLLDATKRFAYDRLGPEMTRCRHCTTVLDYVLLGLQSIAPYYAAGALFMLLLGVLGYLQWGTYGAGGNKKWRWLSLLCLLTFELYTITRPYAPPLSRLVLNPLLATLTSHPPLLPFQLLILARKVGVTLFIAISQLAPLLQRPQQQQPRAGGGQGVPAAATTPDSAMLQQAAELDALVLATDRETDHLLALEMMALPRADGDAAMPDLRQRLRDHLVQNRVRAEPEVRDAVARVVAARGPTLDWGVTANEMEMQMEMR
ncbi:MAG: hypothetical protein M1826_007107 [Phylliscum demangeonii]|nr:MAG: hypothetical protein M1826_007107 [Phylliscum demangeonii]